jgi:hypothetical protein
MTTTGEPTPLRSFMSPFSAWLSGCFSGLFPVSEKTKKKEKKKAEIKQTWLLALTREGKKNFSVTQARADDNHERSTRPHS